jgi:hypothetical protein
MGKMAGTRGSITGAPVMAERANVQIALAKGEAALRGARAFFYEITDEVFAVVQAGTSRAASRPHWCVWLPRRPRAPGPM